MVLDPWAIAVQYLRTRLNVTSCHLGGQTQCPTCLSAWPRIGATWQYQSTGVGTNHEPCGPPDLRMPASTISMHRQTNSWPDTQRLIPGVKDFYWALILCVCLCWLCLTHFRRHYRRLALLQLLRRTWFAIDISASASVLQCIAANVQHSAVRRY